MKEKLAVVLFKTSNQALMFSNFHDNIIGPDYKVAQSNHVYCRGPNKTAVLGIFLKYII